MLVMEWHSALLLMTCGVTIAVGYYAVRGNYHSPLNRLLLAMSCAVVVWSFGQLLSIGAYERALSLLGRRISPLGWGVVAGITLHFVLVLTGSGLLQRKWAIPLVYLPSAVAVFAFSVLPLFGGNADDMVRTHHGWVSTATVDGWDVYYLIHVTLYTLLSLSLLLRWGRRSVSRENRRQASLIGYSLAAAVPLGMVMESAQLYLGLPPLQVSAIFTSALVFLFGHCVNGYRFPQPEPIRPDELILPVAAQSHVNRYFGLGISAGGLALLMAGGHIANPPAHLSAGLVGTLVVVTGMLLLTMDWLLLEEKFKELLVSCALALIIPLKVLWFADAGVLGAWAISFPLMVFCLLFNRRILLLSLLCVSLLTQLYQWAYLPAAAMHIATSDYLLRLGIIGFGALFALYVNRVYTSRLRENINHSHMQTIASQISQTLASIGEENFDEKLRLTLERCVRFVGCDRGYLVLLDVETNNVRHAVEWTQEAAAPRGSRMDDGLRDIRPDMVERFKANNVLILKDARLLPPPAAHVKRSMLAQGIRALANVAVRNPKGELIGFLGFNASRPMGAWNLVSTDFYEILAGIVSDAVAKVEGERGLNHMAYHDQLTDLPNRLRFKETLERVILQAEGTGKLVGVALLDLDGFKAVNDTLGHDQGDQLLVKVAHTLCHTVRESDVVARFGGDEFLLLFPLLSNQQELAEIMERLMEATHRPVLLSGHEFFVSVSAGIALYPMDGQNADTLLQNADTAMYVAKSSGRNRYALCSQAMKDEIAKRVEVTHLLYRALEREQLVLHYQPQVDLTTGSIMGMEALVRWNLPERGIIAPGTFIPLAEQTGLIHPIGHWVLREACMQCKRWVDMGCVGLRVAVNISLQQLKNPRFVQQVEEVLHSTGLAPQHLELEITESVADGNTDSTVLLLHRLKALGVSLSIDDFGTKYSSLSRLKLLPIDRIKVDMQFIHGIERSDKDRAITKVIINLAKSLQLKVLAEGVETTPQLQFLRQRLCDEVQGYYHFKPMPAQETEAVLLAQLHAEGAFTG